jgi:single-strand DNA-binding protein
MYQKITIVGNLGRDPEMRYTPGGQAVTNLNIATNRQYTSNSGERVKETTWFRVSVWGKQAESCNQYLKSGSKVLVEGRMNQDKETGGPRIWTRNDGSPGASFEITAQTVRFLSSRQEDQAMSGGGSGNSSSGSKYGAGNAMEPPQEDEIPF